MTPLVDNLTRSSSIGRAPGGSNPQSSKRPEIVKPNGAVGFETCHPVSGSKAGAIDGSSHTEVVRGSTPRGATTLKKKNEAFQIRWKEPLGHDECPYMHRWVFLAFNYGLRIHSWVRSDDKRFFHDHPWWFLTFVLRGSYIDHSLDRNTGAVTSDELKAGSVRFRPASHLHCVDVPKGGCLTIVISGPPVKKWGFWVHNRILRPLRFFDRYGHPPCSEQ